MLGVRVVVRVDQDFVFVFTRLNNIVEGSCIDENHRAKIYVHLLDLTRIARNSCDSGAAL